MVSNFYKVLLLGGNTSEGVFRILKDKKRLFNFSEDDPQVT